MVGNQEIDDDPVAFRAATRRGILGGRARTSATTSMSSLMRGGMPE
jgi:hypothetical protein